MYEKLFNTLFASIFWFYFFQPWSTFIVELPFLEFQHPQQTAS